MIPEGDLASRKLAEEKKLSKTPFGRGSNLNLNSRERLGIVLRGHVLLVAQPICLTSNIEPQIHDDCRNVG